MKKDPNRTPDAAELRRRAEERLKSQPEDSRGPPTLAEMQRLIHELQVHQIELEMQNDELVAAQAEVEAGLARYTDLYDFAPTGYFTLARDGTIQAVNLTGAQLVGIERAHLLNRRLGAFLEEADRPIFTAFLDKTYSSSTRVFCEVTLPKEGSTPLVVRIEALLSGVGKECQAAMMDVTERHEIEGQRNQLIKQLQDAVAQVKMLSGLLPICAYCKKIRNDRGLWEQLEAYISKHSEATFTHGLCPKCLTDHYPGLGLEIVPGTTRDGDHR